MEKALADKAAADKAAADLAAAQKVAAEAQAAKEAADLKAQQVAAAAAAVAAAENTPERITHAKEVTTQVQSEIDAKKLGAALYHLDLLIAGISSDRAATLVTPFTAVLEPYRQLRDAALGASQAGDPATALASLKAFDTANPGDPKIAMAMATVMTRRAPDPQGLKDELKTMRALSTSDQAARTDPNLQALLTKFMNEQTQYERLASRVDELKNAPHSRSGVAKLVQQRTDAEQKLQSYQALTANPLLAIGVASSIQDKQREIASLTEKINDIQSEPIISESEVEAAQQRFDDFIAAVPW